MEHHIVAVVALIAVAGVVAQWVAWRTGLPAIVVLLAAGIAAGPGLGWLDPADTFGHLFQPLIGLAVAIIVFEGGLNLNLRELRAAGGGVLRLVALGAPLSWGLGAAAGHWLGGLSWPLAILFGAILIVTGPTVIMPLLRQARLHERPASYLKWEGIVNDPIGAVLAVLVLEFLSLQQHMGDGEAAGILAFNVVEGAVLALALGIGLPFAIRWAFRHSQAPEVLKTPILLASVLGIHTVCNLVQAEAGLIGATAFGVVLANIGITGLAELRRFKESLTVFLVSGLFIVLSANLDAETIGRVSWPILGATAAVMFVARPVSILISTIGADMPWRERALLAWIAPRGIVAAAVAGIATGRLQGAGYADAGLILPMVFSVIVATVVLHGLTIGPLARALGLAAKARSGLLVVGSSDWVVALARTVHALGVPVIVADRAGPALAEARRHGLETHATEVLSEDPESGLDLLEVDHVLAATRDDAYNALVCTRFAPEMGREQVHQIAPRSGAYTKADAATRDWRGRVVLREDAHHDHLAHLLKQGWSFRSIPFRGKLPDACRPDADGWNLLVVRPDGSLTVLSPEADAIVPAEGTLVRFAAPDPEPDPAARLQREPAAGR